MKKDSQFSLALVTGATSGIGTALCALLAKEKIPLLMTGRNVERLRDLVETFKTLTPTTAIAADLSKQNELKNLIDKIHEYQPELVINNAGLGFYGEALTHSIEEHMEIINVNAVAAFQLTLEAAKAMREAGKQGIILNVSSAASFLIFPDFATYSASKAFVTHFSQSLDYEFSRYGIRVLIACPGMVSTAFRSRSLRISSIKDMPKESEKLAFTSPKRQFFKLFGYNSASMNPDLAAAMLWKQIKSRKKVSIFGWKTRLGILFSYIVPKRLSAAFLSNAIKKVLSKNSPNNSDFI